jgi:hypothetical protein
MSYREMLWRVHIIVLIKTDVGPVLKGAMATTMTFPMIQVYMNIGVSA